MFPNCIAKVFIRNTSWDYLWAAFNSVHLASWLAQNAAAIPSMSLWPCFDHGHISKPERLANTKLLHSFKRACPQVLGLNFSIFPANVTGVLIARSPTDAQIVFIHWCLYKEITPAESGVGVTAPWKTSLTWESVSSRFNDSALWTPEGVNLWMSGSWDFHSAPKGEQVPENPAKTNSARWGLSEGLVWNFTLVFFQTYHEIWCRLLLSTAPVWFGDFYCLPPLSAYLRNPKPCFRVFELVTSPFHAMLSGTWQTVWKNPGTPLCMIPGPAAGQGGGFGQFWAQKGEDGLSLKYPKVPKKNTKQWGNNWENMVFLWILTQQVWLYDLDRNNLKARLPRAHFVPCNTQGVPTWHVWYANNEMKGPNF